MMYESRLAIIPALAPKLKLHRQSRFADPRVVTMAQDLGQRMGWRLNEALVGENAGEDSHQGDLAF